MARFRSSPVPQIWIHTKLWYRRRDFSSPGLKSGSYTFGGEAAGMVSLADTYSAASAGTRPDQLITAAQEMKRAERDAVADATASTFANAYMEHSKELSQQKTIEI